MPRLVRCVEAEQFVQVPSSKWLNKARRPDRMSANNHRGYRPGQRESGCPDESASTW
jgi:hypothetical protein